MITNIPKSFDSKFRFIIVAAQRAKQLQSGVAPRIDLETRKSACIATKEVEQGLVNYEILEEQSEEQEEEE